MRRGPANVMTVATRSHSVGKYLSRELGSVPAVVAFGSRQGYGTDIDKTSTRVKSPVPWLKVSKKEISNGMMGSSWCC